MQDKLVTFLEDSNVSVKELAEKADMEEVALQAFINGDTDELTIGTIRKICRALNCRIEDIFYI